MADMDVQIKFTAVSGQAIKAIDELNKSIDSIGADFVKAGIALKGFSAAIDSFEKSAKKLGRDLSVNVTAPIVALAGLSLKNVFDSAIMSKGSEEAQRFAGNVQALKKQFDELTLSIGQKLLPVANRVVYVFSKIMDEFSKLSSETQKMVVDFGLIAAAVGPVILAMSSFLGVFSKIIAAVGSFLQAAGAIVAAINPVIAAVVAASYVLTGLFNVFNGLRKSGVDTVDALLQAFSLVPAFLNKYLMAPIVRLVGISAELLSKFTGLFSESLASGIKSAADTINNTSMVLYGRLDEVKASLDSQLAKIGSSVADSFTFGFSSKFSDFSKSFEEGFREFDNKAITLITDFDKRVMETARQINNSIASNMSNAFLDFADGTKTAEQAFNDMAKSIIKNILQMILQMKLFNAIAGANGAGGLGGLFAPAATAPTSAIAGFASGGFVSGPGTGTSDSIMARLSNGEFVSDAATVKHFGSDFFHNLKSFAKRGAPSSRKSSMPAFAEGGLAGGNGGPKVVIQNSGSPKEVSSTSYDPSTAVTTVILEDIQKNGTISKALQGTFNVKRGGFA